MRGPPRAALAHCAGGGSVGGSSASSSSCSSAATRYGSVAHAPRSIILQRSEQNGRDSLSARQGTCFPHCGQGTYAHPAAHKLQNVSSNSTSGSTVRGRCCASDGDEADVERVLVGADLRDALGGSARRTRTICAMRPPIICWNMPWCAMSRAGLPLSRRSLQHDRGAVADRQERREPRLQIGEPCFAFAMQPEVVGGQVELAHAARYAGPLLDRHQPFVVAQLLTDLAHHVVEAGMRLIDVAHDRGEHLLVDLGARAERVHHLLLTLELLQEIGLEVGTAGDIQDLEHREQRHVMLGGSAARGRTAHARTGPRDAAASECARSADTRN